MAAMDAISIVLIALLCTAAGAAAGWFAAAARFSARTAAAQAAAAALESQLAAVREAAREQAVQARSEQAGRDERERREQSVLRALAPVQESLSLMQQKVDELERERLAQFGSISEQLRRAQQSDDALRESTERLAGALRAGSTRGVWGETQLRRVVEAAGLTRHVDFETQTSITTDAGAGRPDMIVRLPGDKALALDAKAPLDAFLDASAIGEGGDAAASARRETLLRAHARAVRAHVDALAKKAYWEGLAHSPEFVICFLPGEALLSTALDQDPGLLEYAFSKRVALASPVNLWAVLKTVAYTWTQQDVADEAKTLFALGTELYGRLGSLAGHADDLRRAIERTVASYNKFAGSLESRVLVTARRFPGIDETKLDATLPPAQILDAPRALTAPELTDHTPITADVGELRGRVADDVERRAAP